MYRNWAITRALSKLITWLFDQVWLANLCMEVTEEFIAISSTIPPRIWKRYIDDSFVIATKDAVTSFHEPKIPFTIEAENNNQIATLVIGY